MRAENSTSCNIKNSELDELDSLSSKLFKDFTFIDKRFQEINMFHQKADKK